ncbi:TetR/AcrR family transcriptional regulator [Microbacterium sp. LMI1-1-1.1]|uniref:TetR/AcrR family transcriptional regulator n=1 Tax=Microbacterium sp. LMI1-1-1.1 TaxID=3135223 RepID=UPI0034667965
MNDETSTRNPERTRRAILDAALQVIRDRGTSASLSHISTAAGVTKGGLMHHFPSRDALLRAVASDVLEEFRRRVFALVDLSETQPGKLLRGYIRALFGEDWRTESAYDYPGLWATLSVVPGVQAQLEADAMFWRSGFAEDGLHPDRILVARHAAEGLSMSLQWDLDPAPGALDHAIAVLLQLTLVDGNLTGG